MKKLLIMMLILLLAFTQMAAAQMPVVDGYLEWNHKNGAEQTTDMLDCSDYDPVGEDGYLHWVASPDADFTDAYIQVGDDSPWFRMDTSKVSSDDMRHFYTEPYYDEDELADMNVTVEYYGTASDKTIIKLSHYCPGPENDIPEFSTIALPIAAIIGLAFIFQRRKE